MNISAAEAARHLLKIKAAQSSFLGYIKLRHPDWIIPDFHLMMIEALDRLEKNTLRLDFLTEWNTGVSDPSSPLIRNIAFTMPPRHSKSTLATVEFPSYYMLRKPSRFSMTASYNKQLAVGFGRQVRDCITNPLVEQAFPNFQLSNQARSAEEWRTVGEHGEGAYFSLGLNGTTSGRPACLLNIDDPLKSRPEAESATARQNVWDYYTSALSSRLQPELDGTPPAQIVCLTRWHPDDLLGRLQELDEWDTSWLHINMPAETGIGTPQHRALWPERGFGLDYLRQKRALDPREYESLYLQNPYVEGGNLLKASWWNYYDPKTELPDHFSSIIIAADTAFKKDESNDPSVAIVAGLTFEGDIYILQLVKGRWEFPELKQKLIALNAYWRGKGLRGIYIEDKASGQSLIQELQRQSGMSVIPYKINSDKVARVHSVTPLIQGGRVYLPALSTWLDDFIQETLAFPAGKHDDQVDALAIILDVLSRMFVDPSDLDAATNMGTSLNTFLNATSSVNDSWSRDSLAKALGYKGSTPLGS